MKIKSHIKNNGGILLDIGAGENRQPNFLRLDRRKEVNPDILWDLEKFPYPIPDDSCLIITGSHILEHIKPWVTIDFFNELWRIMKPDGQLALSMPYGYSFGFVQDPTHCNPCNQATFQYFDPDCPLYKVYKPKPWKIEIGFPVWQATGNMEVMMRKRKES